MYSQHSISIEFNLRVANHVYSARSIIGDTQYGFPRGPARCTNCIYQLSFNPNWICRDVVVVPVINPAVPAGAPEVVSATGEGRLKFE
jgi:hypothetical protein